MITSSTWGRRALFSTEVWANLLIDTLYHYRGTAYLLHEFVVMPDHIHAILTPKTSLEKAVQFIKGVTARLEGVPFQPKIASKNRDAMTTQAKSKTA
jgi:REP element-mobilizing transposase RayT